MLPFPQFHFYLPFPVSCLCFVFSRSFPFGWGLFLFSTPSLIFPLLLEITTAPKDSFTLSTSFVHLKSSATSLFLSFDSCPFLPELFYFSFPSFPPFFITLHLLWFWDSKSFLQKLLELGFFFTPFHNLVITLHFTFSYLLAIFELVSNPPTHKTKGWKPFVLK